MNATTNKHPEVWMEEQAENVLQIMQTYKICATIKAFTCFQWFNMK